LAAGLRDRYALERPLGRGGMATVYLARDLKHDRPVALKVLLPELAASLGPERFQREIKLAARLQHPHILTVHDSGETAGQLWFTMPYVEGQSLRDKLRRERQLPVDEALRIAREAAAALDYAHRHGVIHRDIKPENILITSDGDTLVADFGIARALRGADEGPESGTLTATGMSVGTPAYMSPEQASGDKALDARTDVYSLGCVLYEVLAGEPPYTGPSAQQIIVKRFTEPVPSVRKVRPSVPASVDQTVQRALAPLPADRFATAADFARALQVLPDTPTPPAGAAAVPSTPPTAPTVPLPVRTRRVPVAAITLALGFLIGLGVLFAWRRTHGAVEGAGAKVLAVLPFENLGDSSDAYFADGVTEDVRGKLSRIAGLAVIARNSSNEYRHTTKRPQEIARELGADYLLTATVRWEKIAGGVSRVRVTPELVEAGPGHAPRTRWQEPFDASLTDVFQVQAEIANKVASALDVALADSARRSLAAKPTANLDAYDAYLKGEALSSTAGVDPPTLRRAIGYYEQAVALDSAFVPAWNRLARARTSLYANSTPTPELARQARDAAERARALDPRRPDGLWALSSYYGLVEADNRQSLAAAEAALKLAPDNPDLLVLTASAEQAQGRWEASIPKLVRAGALDPRSARIARNIGTAFLWLRRYPEAEKALDRTVSLAPTSINSIELRAMAALGQGDLDGARAVVRTALATLEPARLFAYFGLYWDLYWVLEDSQQRELLTLPPDANFDNDRGAWGLMRAQLHHLRGNRSQARLYADSARLAFEEQLQNTPDDAQRIVLRGLALAYLGRKAESIAAGQHAVALMPTSRDAFQAPYMQHQLARIYLLVGEPDKALDQFEGLLKVPYYLSPGWLRIDPTFAPLKGHPRFERLIAGS
jgi:serine/threonine-protein kinase